MNSTMKTTTLAALVGAGTLFAAPMAGAQQPAKLVHHQTPSYPVTAQRQGVEGWVRLALTVDEAGSVRDVSIVESQPAQVFDRAAVDAAREWRFDPATVRADGPQIVRVDFAL